MPSSVIAWSRAFQPLAEKCALMDWHQAIKAMPPVKGIHNICKYSKECILPPKK